MKKSLSILLIFLFFLSFALPAQADIIYEPSDSFYESHRDDCSYHNRSYTARIDTHAYTSPELSIKVGNIQENSSVYVIYTYQDAEGNLWGYVEDDITGWVPLAYFAVVYDYISFQEDYGHMFTDESGDLSEDYVEQYVHFYVYPGGPDSYPLFMDGGNSPHFTHTYTDDFGHKWGYIAYYYGHRNSWICLDNPTADFAALYPEGEPSVIPETTLSPLPEADIVPKGNDFLQIGITVAVFLCAGVSCGMLFFMKKRK